jgi:hypothetical protein
VLVIDLADPSEKTAKGNTVFAVSSTMLYPIFRLSVSLFVLSVFLRVQTCSTLLSFSANLPATRGLNRNRLTLLFSYLDSLSHFLSHTLRCYNKRQFNGAKEVAKDYKKSSIKSRSSTEL